MLEAFLSYIESNLSINATDKILISVSGGVDSMVMLHLFQQSSHPFIVAHIDHSTRNGASQSDHNFVSEYCKNHGIEFYSKKLDYERLTQGNFQENARIARFEFLAEIKEKTNCNWIATAHHKDDRWETFLMNLNRKSGINGLTSLRPKVDNVIHPLLSFTKRQIETYASLHNLDFVHDSSNDSDTYVRNSIRLNVNPPILNLFPNFIAHANASINHLSQSNDLMDELITKQNIFSFDVNKQTVEIDLKTVKEFSNQVTLLYHMLQKFDFKFSVAQDVLSTAQTGAMFSNDTYEALIDRDKMLIRKHRDDIPIRIEISQPGEVQLPDGRKVMIELATANQSDLHLCLDAKKVLWPLTIRKIKPGDAFKPMGMRGSTKTIKKLCTDLKIDRFTKRDLLLVCQGDKILQIIGIKSSYDCVPEDIKNAISFKISH